MGSHSAKTAALAEGILELAGREGLGPGDRLPEQWLASELRLSRTPVRAALAVLVGMGLAERRPGQGCYLLASPADGEPGEALRADNDETRLYRDIARARFTNQIPEQVSVADLMRRFDRGRALVNRVLARMAEEGVVERAAGQGYRFGPVLNSAAAYRESYRYRLLIEPAALLESGFRMLPRKIDVLREQNLAICEGRFEHLAIDRLFEVDAAFHGAIGEASGNRFLADAIVHQVRLRRLSEYESYHHRDQLRESSREHLAILDAIEQDDRELAAERLRDHIRHAERVRPDFDRVRTLAHRRLTRA